MVYSPHLHNSQESGSFCVADKVSTPHVRYHVGDDEDGSPEPRAVAATGTSKEALEPKKEAVKKGKRNRFTPPNINTTYIFTPTVDFKQGLQ